MTSSTHFFQIAGINCTIDTEECASTPCLYGGTCTEPVPNQYQCDCPPGIEGSNCQDVFTATFEGQGPLVVNYRSGDPGTEVVEIPRRKRQAAQWNSGWIKFPNDPEEWNSSFCAKSKLAVNSNLSKLFPSVKYLWFTNVSGNENYQSRSG